MYNDSDSFYFSETYDLTNSLQQQNSPDYQNSLSKPLCERADDRFFWNRPMLDDLCQPEEEVKGPSKE
jgi:hypothetical protein